MRAAPEIFLVRHGQTAWNAVGRYQGALDSPLTDLGREQARTIGVRLAGLVPADIAIQVSPLGRARQTADLICAAAGLRPAATDTRLREVTLGQWDGLLAEDIDALWPGRLDGSTRFDWYFRAPDGESYERASERADGWIASLRAPVVAVSHGLMGRFIRGACLGLTREEALSLPVPQDVIWHLRAGQVTGIPV